MRDAIGATTNVTRAMTDATTQATPPTRLASVDAWRCIAMVAVVAIHTTPAVVADPADRGRFVDPSFVVNEIARFAVPFFFVVSGFFWGERAARAAAPLRASWPTARRLLLIFVVWTIVYALPYDVGTMAVGGPTAPLRTAWWHLHALAAQPWVLLTQGTKSHLWFLVALLCAQTIAATLVQWRRTTLLVVLAVALYTVELLSKPYVHTALGVPLAFNTRNGPFVGTLFFVAGWWLSRRPDRAAWLPVGIALFAFGIALHLFESWFVATRLGVVELQDFVVGTVPMGVGAAMIALSGLPRAAERTAAVGRDTLGIYLVHAIFVDLFLPLSTWSPPIVGHVADVAAVFAASLVTVRLLGRSRRVRALIS